MLTVSAALKNVMASMIVGLAKHKKMTSYEETLQAFVKDLVQAVAETWRDFDKQEPLH